VRHDLGQLAERDVGISGSLSEMALRLASAYDEYDGEDLSKLARLNMELRQTLTALVREVGDDGDAEQAAHLSTPVWDGAQPGAADARSEGGGGRRPAG
jgi:hypothetical protein